jgi:type IV secretion system protein TrbL
LTLGASVQDAILDGIQQQFGAATAGWYSTVFPYARKLFFALVLIELTWAAALCVLEREDSTAVATGLLKKIIATTFFYAILLNASSWIPAVLDSFTGIGAAAAGINELTPSGVLTQGINLAAKMLEPLGVLGFVTATIASIIGGLAALGVVFAFGIIAAQLLLTNVESYIIVGGGILLLGFAGSRWTTDVASRYLSYAVAIGIKLFTLYLIIGIGNSLAGQWSLLLASPDATLNPKIYFQILGGALSYMMLAWYIPSLAASLYSGTVALSLAELAYTGRSVGTAGGSAGIATLAAGAAAADGTRAVVEAARFGGDIAAERGGWAGAATGALSGAGALAREGLRSAVPTLAARGNTAANRISETRAIRQPRLAGYQPASRGESRETQSNRATSTADAIPGAVDDKARGR